MSNLMDKLDGLISDIDAINKRLEGDGSRPSLLSRVIQLEQFQNTLRWSIGVLYSAVIGVLVTLIIKKV